MGVNLRRLYACATLMLLLSTSSFADIVISEIMPCNISTLINDQYNFTGWVEFYNNDSSAVNLKGSEIINYKSSGKVKWQWTVNYDCTIAAGKYKVIFFDKLIDESTGEAISNHAPYKVDSDGGSLELYSSDGSTSSIVYTEMKPHVSYGLYESTYGYMEPTPNASNTFAVSILATGRCATPTFSGTKPGVFSKNSTGSISLSCNSDGAKIYYTTDGSEPTKTNGTLYSKSISFSSTTCIRARAYLDGYISSEILTGSYIVYGDERQYCNGTDAPVVSITTNDDYFYDDQIGISVTGTNGIAGIKSCIASKANYNQDWDRAVNFEYFVDNAQVVSQEAQVGVMGGCSRLNDVKSLKISTDKETGNELFNYSFFKDDENKVDNQYASLQLRNGGNAYSSDNVRCRDGFMQTIAKSMGNIDYQAYQPVAYYLNGEYMGLMGLRERSNKDYVFSNYGYEDDEIDVIEITQEGYTATCGDTEAYSEMIDFAQNNNSNADFLTQVNNYLDLDEYLNYMIFEQFIVNTDWPSNNCKLWRQRAGGKFRWITFDTDFGFGLYGASSPNYCDVNLNMIEWCMGTGSNVNWANGDPDTYEFTEDTKWKTILFSSLMQNEDFKQMYLTKSLMHLANAFEINNIKSIWSDIVAKAQMEYCATFSANNAYYQKDLNSDGESMLEFAETRVGVVYKQLASFYGLTNTLIDLNISCDNSSTGFYLNNAPVDASSYTLSCLKGMNVKIAAKLPNGYIVDKWVVGTTEYTTESIEVTMDAATTVKLYIKEEPYTTPNILINEICAKNTILVDEDTQSKPDWIELYNAGDTDVDIAGLYLSDVTSDPLLSQIASGYSTTIIPAKGHLLLWADGNNSYGPLHVDFKLSDTSGETITLTKVVRDSAMTVCQLTFGTLGENNSYGRITDGAETFKIFYPCEDNIHTESTPGSANGTVDCDSVMKANAVSIELSSAIASAGFSINGTDIYQNPYTYNGTKLNTITISPIIPEGCTFEKWELSTATNFTNNPLSASSNWSYYYIGEAPAGDWTSINYDDSAWETGSGRIGYSNDSRIYNTELTAPEEKYITTYFRGKFSIDNLSEIDSLVGTLTYDDGAIIYLNGTEIGRYNLAEGTIGYDSTTINYNDDISKKLTIDKDLLLEGDNLFAVEVHQYNSSSSDLTFSLNATAYGSTFFNTEETLTLIPTENVAAILHLSGTAVVPDPEPSLLTISANNTDCGYTINGNQISQYNYSVECMTGDTFTITPIIPYGYTFESWSVNQVTNSSDNLVIILRDTTTITLNVTEIPLPDLFINEICNANSTTENDLNETTSSWIELYNNGSSSINLSDIYISSSRSNLTENILDGSISAKGYRLFWADGNDQVTSHLEMILEENTTQNLYISTIIDGNIYVIDTLHYTVHAENGSFGRISDASEETTAFEFCIDGVNTEATPGSANGTVNCETAILENMITITIVSNTENVGYTINGEIYATTGDTLEIQTFKNKELTITPIMPAGYEFKHWGESQQVVSRIDTVNLLTATSTWSYYYASDIPATNWAAVSFDDSNWNTGYGLMGYSSYETVDTKLDYGTNSKSKYTTAYFRIKFEIEDLDYVNRILGSLKYDDGAAIYMNGQEVVRYNLGTDSILYSTLTPTGANTTDTFSINKSYLTEGINVLAVEVHQNKGTSTDLLFQLLANIEKITYTEDDVNTNTNLTLQFTASSDSSLTLFLGQATDIQSIVGDALSLNIYPNPAADYLSITLNNANTFDVIITDNKGRMVRQEQLSGLINTISLDGLSSGVYYLQVISGSNSFSEKFIKE